MKTSKKLFSAALASAAILFVLAINANSILKNTLNLSFSVVENEFIKTLRDKLQKLSLSHSEDRLYLLTDKPFYNSGETVWFSGFVRNGSDLSASRNSEVLHVEVINPVGAVSKRIDLIALNGHCRGEFDLEQELPGGIYKIKAFTTWMKNDSTFFEKEITVQDVVLPRLKMNLDFEREAYAPSDEVSAKLMLETNENKPLSNFPFNYVVQIGGNEILKQTSSTGNNGEMFIRFKLPAKLKTSDGLLNVMLDYEGQGESVSRSVPIVLNNVKMQLFPEGGDLVENLETRVAFRALNDKGKPADIAGIVLDKNGKEVAKFTSFAKGMGHFTLKPEPGQTYTAKVTSPKCDAAFELPAALPNGFVLTVAEQSGTELPVSIQSTINGKSSVVASVRGKILWATEFAVNPGNNQLLIPTDNFPAGVAQITVFDPNGIARAERLAFVNTNKNLRIKLSTDKEKYLPREKVRMTVQTMDNNNLPVASQLALSVVNDQLLSFADDKQHNIFSQLLLQYDIHEKIEEPSYFFNPKEAKAPQALDYLLMTAGWRRFRWEEIVQDKVPHFGYSGEKAEISGIINDGHTYKPIAGAFVKLKGSRTTARTDEKGQFTLGQADITMFDKLELMMPGYTNAEVAVTKLGNIGTNYLYDPKVVLLDAVYVQEERMERQVMRLAPMAAVNCAAAPMNNFQMNMGNAAVAKAEKLKFKQEAKVKTKAAKNVIHDAEQPINQPRQEKALAEVKIVDKQEKDVLAKKGNGKFKNDLKGLALKDEAFNEKLEDEQPFDNNVGVRGEVHFIRSREFPINNYDEKLNPGERRSDFRSTIYFNGLLETDRTGKKTIEFFVSDEITSFRATAEGIGSNGMLGREEKTIFSQLPLSLSVKIPVSCILGDVLSIPVTIKNNTSASISGNLTVSAPSGFAKKGDAGFVQILAANQAKTIYMSYEVGGRVGLDSIRIAFDAGNFSDNVIQKIKTEANGFPVNMAFAGKELEAEHEVNLTNLIPGSLQVSLTAYPSVVSDLMKGVESILNEPSGCFEQSSMSSYPNVMVLDYLKTIDSKDEKILKRANDLLDKGYKRLVVYETKEKGYEWFGGSPGHEALTAYGLMQFNDMKNVYASVDDKMVDRTANWLLSKRNGNGGFVRNGRALDQFGAADQDITDAYIVYALADAGYKKDLQKEINECIKQAMNSKDPYTVGMMTVAAVKNNDMERAAKLVSLLLEKQEKDGSWKAKKHSITKSGGQGLTIETTSMALMGLMAYDKGNNGEINKGVEFLVKNRNAFGGYGSTQATILCLKALTQYAKASKKAGEDGTIEFYAEGRKIAEQAYTKDQKDPLELRGLENFLKEGKSTLKIKYRGVKNALPYSLALTYNTNLPQSSKECVVGIETSIASQNVKQSETLRMTVNLKNLTNEGQPSTMAVLGLPSGLSAQPWQLKELMEKQVFDYYEIKDNKLFLYYRQLKPSEDKEINLDLKAELPGTYTAPASCAYLYYTSEFKNWKGLAGVTVSK